jgi:hypothetical protein
MTYSLVTRLPETPSTQARFAELPPKPLAESPQPARGETTRAYTDKSMASSIAVPLREPGSFAANNPRPS